MRDADLIPTSKGRGCVGCLLQRIMTAKVDRTLPVQLSEMDPGGFLILLGGRTPIWISRIDCNCFGG